MTMVSAGEEVVFEAMVVGGFEVVLFHWLRKRRRRRSGGDGGFQDENVILFGLYPCWG